MTEVAFLIISFLSLLLFYFGIGKDKILLSVFLTWQIIVGIIASFKIFENKPNLFPLVILGTVLLTFFTLKRIEKQKPNTKILLFIHVLRIPVELVLFQLFLQNKIPNLMTFKGWNLDIFMGVSAFIILLYQVSNRKFNKQFLIVWNIIGIVFLIFIVSLAILSSPLPIQQFAFDQPNIGLLEFPYCFLPSCVVPIVLMSHILLIKKQHR